MKTTQTNEREPARGGRRSRSRPAVFVGTALLGAAIGAPAITAGPAGAAGARAAAGSGESTAPGSRLAETRLTMDKWIETQQIISKERNDWYQGKEILTSRVELLG